MHFNACTARQVSFSNNWIEDSEVCRQLKQVWLGRCVIQAAPSTHKEFWCILLYPHHVLSANQEGSCSLEILSSLKICVCIFFYPSAYKCEYGTRPPSNEVGSSYLNCPALLSWRQLVNVFVSNAEQTILFCWVWSMRASFQIFFIHVITGYIVALYSYLPLRSLFQNAWRLYMCRGTKSIEEADQLWRQMTTLTATHTTFKTKWKTVKNGDEENSPACWYNVFGSAICSLKHV